MPPSDVPIPDLGPQLLSVLLRSVGWLALASVVVGVVTWWLGRVRPAAMARFGSVLFGDPDDAQPEPSARRFLRVCFGLLWIADGLLQAQPHMPGGFIADVIAPGLSTGPSWLADLDQPFVDMWTKHPVTADAVTVWIQVGLGLLVLIGGRGVLARVVLWLSILWGAAVWVLGEVAGGLASPGASWLTGAPGAVLVYIVAAGALLAPWSWWTSGRSARLIRQAVGGWMLAGAVLQAIPWEGSWTAAGLSAPFTTGAAMTQPSYLRGPISAMASLSTAHPAVVNAVLIALLTAVGLGLCLTKHAGFVVAGVVLCAATWWLGQDFGVFGGTATDPNTGLPLALLLSAALPQWSPQDRPATATAPRQSLRRTPWIAGVAACGIGALVAAPLVVSGLLFAPADATAVVVDSGGGVVELSPRPTPQFALTDQNGNVVSSSQLRGKLTLITFLDPVCSDECPVIANQLAEADRQLGALAGRVEIVAVDSNPVFHEVSDVEAFTTSHGLNDLPNWHFLVGSEPALRELLTAYGIAVAVPTVGMIEHTEGIFFVSADGFERAYLGDGANADLTSTYGDQVGAEIRKLLA